MNTHQQPPRHFLTGVKIPHNEDYFMYILSLCEEFYEKNAVQTPSHDIGHIRRVLKNAFDICSYTDVDCIALLIAVYFHDIITHAKGSLDDLCSASKSAELARSVFSQIVSRQSIDTAVDAINAHRFSHQRDHTNIVSMILYDADKLDSLGAIGIARLFCVAAELNSSICSMDDPLGYKRPLDDKQFALDHFFRKLFIIPSTMTTLKGREMAKQRIIIMKNYVMEISNEIASS